MLRVEKRVAFYFRSVAESRSATYLSGLRSDAGRIRLTALLPRGAVPIRRDKRGGAPRRGSAKPDCIAAGIGVNAAANGARRNLRSRLIYGRLIYGEDRGEDVRVLTRVWLASVGSEHVEDRVPYQ